MRTREVAVALKGLYERFRSEPDAVLADPIWRQVREKDVSFLRKTPPSFRLDLLRHQFNRYPTDPWAPLRGEAGEELQWPKWDVPAWDIGSGVHPAERGGITSRRVSLIAGWSCEFYAQPAEVWFEVYEVYFEGDRPTNDTTFPLDVVLKQLFTNPAADPREALGGTGVSAGPRDGSDMLYRGVRLYSPNLGLLETEDEDCFFYDGSEASDAALIAQLVSHKGHFFRDASPDEVPRPLFARAPSIDYEDQSGGHLVCSWKTDYFAPVSAVTGERQRWRYKKSELDVVEAVHGTPYCDLVEYAWNFKTMGILDDTADSYYGALEVPISEAIAAPRAHKFLLPTYDRLLFGE